MKYNGSATIDLTAVVVLTWRRGGGGCAAKSGHDLT